MLSNLLLELGISLLFVALGTSMVKGNIKWLHSYHRKRIKKEDEMIVGKWCGYGLYIISIGIALSAIMTYMGYVKFGSLLLIPFLVIGIGMNAVVIMKYNKGLF